MVSVDVKHHVYPLSDKSPGEIKRREVELGFHRELDNPFLHSFLNNCFSDIGFVTLFRTAVETAVSEVHKLLRSGGVPTSLSPFLTGRMFVRRTYFGHFDPL